MNSEPQQQQQPQFEDDVAMGLDDGGGADDVAMINQKASSGEEVTGLDMDSGDGDERNAETIITIIPTDGWIADPTHSDPAHHVEKNCFQLPYKYVEMSRVWKIALENNTEETELALASWTYDDIVPVVAWMEYHEGVMPEVIPEPLTDKELKKNKNCTEFDAALVDDIFAKSSNDFYQFLKVVNALDIHSLLALCVSKIASLCKGVAPDQIEAILTGKKPPASASGTTPPAASAGSM